VADTGTAILLMPGQVNAHPRDRIRLDSLTIKADDGRTGRPPSRGWPIALWVMQGAEDILKVTNHGWEIQVSPSGRGRLDG